MPIQEIINYATQIAEGLQAAHEKGIIHRDIKSANIMVTDKGQIKITDFGLAKLSGHLSTVQDGITMGKLAYMSPEQVLAKEMDHRTDIWSFGVVLYESLSGRLPFEGKYEQEFVYIILHKEPDPLNNIRSNLPSGLCKIVHKTLQKDPEERYQSMQEILLDIKKVLPHGAGRHNHYDFENTLLESDAEIPIAHISSKGERRQLSIVVSTLNGYDSLVENLEQQEVNDVIKAIGKKAVEIANSREGFINQFSEDEIVMLFGIPFTHEDDLSRAVRSALDLHVFISQLNQELSDKISEEINIHSGIDAGRVVVQPRNGRNGRFKLTGEPKKIASRLAAEANSDEILVSSKSRRQIKSFFHTEPCGESFIIRGRAQPVKPFVIRGESRFRSRFEAVANAALTPFTGRDKELKILRRKLRNVMHGAGQFTTIIAEAGFGKSRLIYEFKNQIDDDVHILQAGCQSYARDIPYFPFAILLREFLKIGYNDSDQNLEEFIVSRIMVLDPRLEVYLPMFLQLLSIDSAKYPLPEHLESGHIQQIMVEAISAILTVAANKKPLVILLEDWHWVDDASQYVLKHLVEKISDFRLHLVVTYRPDVSFEWDGAADRTQMQLTPLDESCSGRVVKSMLGANSLAEDLAALIHQRSAGNPFFLEELTHSLLEGGIIKVVKQTVHLTDSKNKIDLPDTIQAVIRSRLDRLDPDTLEVLRVAAVIGLEFTQDILERALTDEIELSESLNKLNDLSLIRQIPASQEVAYRFQHILTQEVVYDSLLKRERKILHGVIGAVLEKVYDTRSGEQVTLLMNHFSKAENWQKAIHYGRIGSDPFMVNSFPSVLNILERVETWTAKLPEDQERKAILIEILLKMERTCESLGLINRQEKIIERLLALIRHDDINRAEVFVRLGDLFILTNRLQEAESALKKAHSLSKNLHNKDTMLRALRSMGYLKVHSGLDDEAAAIIRRVIEFGSDNGKASVLVPDLNSLFTILMRLGDFDGAKKCLDDALKLLDRVPVHMQTYINFMGGSYYRHAGDFDKAISCFKTLVRLWEELGIYGKPTVGMVPLAHIYLMKGKEEEALQWLNKAVETSRKAKIVSELAIALFEKGKVLTSLGRIHEAVPHLEEASLLFDKLKNLENKTQVLCEIAKSLEKDDKKHAGFILNSMAATLIKLKQGKQALIRLEEAMQYHKQANQPLLEGHALAMLGDIYFDLKEINRAKRSYEKSSVLRRKIGDRKGEGWMSLRLAKVFKVQGLATKSQSYAQKALKIAKECDDRDFLEEVQAYIRKDRTMNVISPN